MAPSSMLFDFRPNSAVRSRFLYFSIAFLLACVSAASQEIDTALYQSDRPDYSLLDDIDEPDERKAMSSLLAAEEPEERLKLAKDFLERHPQSWHLGRVFGMASRAAFRLGDHAAALRYGEESLRFFPEDSLLLVPMAALHDAAGRTDEAVALARRALDSLDRFARPSNIPELDWQALQSDLRSMAELILRRRNGDAKIAVEPRLSLSDLTTPRSGALYAGSDECKSCHPSQHSEWSRTGMGRMLRRYEPNNVIGDFSRREFRDDSGVTVGLLRNEQGHFFEIPGADGEPKRLPVDYVIGSKWQQAYATELPDGRIHVFPIQYNRLQGRWLNYWRLIDPPRSKRTDITAFSEFDHATNYQFHCAPCHTSQLAFSPPDSNRLEDIRFKEGGVNCEMCHGPSAAHAQAFAAGRLLEKKPSDPPVDFQSIGQEQYTRICAQCHMQSAMFRRGVEGELNHSGDPTVFFQHLRSRPFSEFSKKAFYKDGRFRETTFVVESLLRSKCFQIGGVTCGHCHDPHGANAAENPKSLKLRDQPNRMCLQCHSEKGVGLTAHTRHEADSKASECTSCHMPPIMNSLLFKAGTHRIDDIPDPERTSQFGAQESPNACLICHTDKNPSWLTESLSQWKAAVSEDRIDAEPRLSEEVSRPLDALLAAIDQAVSPDGFSFLVEARNWTELAKRANAKLKSSPDDPNLHYWLGIAHSQNDLIEAARAFRRAEKLGLSTTALHKALGLTYYNLNQYILFVEQMEKASALDPTDSGPNHYLGRYYELQLNNFPKALSYFERALQQDPDDIKSLYFKGYCLQMLDRRDEASEVYRMAAALVQSNGENYGWPYQKLAELMWREEPETAVAYARKAVELEPDVAEHRMALGKIYEQLGRLEESLTERKRAADLRPSDPAIPYQLMRLYRKLGRDNEADAALQRHKRLRQIYGTPE